MLLTDQKHGRLILSETPSLRALWAFLARCDPVVLASAYGGVENAVFLTILMRAPYQTRREMVDYFNKAFASGAMKSYGCCRLTSEARTKYGFASDSRPVSRKT
jgi:hypothetical protein